MFLLMAIAYGALYGISRLMKNGRGGVSFRPQDATTYQPEANAFYGTNIPVGFAKRAVVGVPLWKGRERLSGTNSNNFRRELDFATAFGVSGVPSTELVESKLLRLWADGILVIDRTTEEGIAASQDIRFTIYPGSETQLPDPLIEAQEGVGETPAFRGMVYIVFERFPLHRFELTRVPVMRAELVDVINPFAIVHEFTRLPGAVDDTGGSALAAFRCATDWQRQRLYTFDRSDSAPMLSMYSIVDNFQMLVAPITTDGITPIPDIVWATSNSGGPVYDPHLDTIIFFNDAGSNYDINAIDPFTGARVANYPNVGSDLGDLPQYITSVRSRTAGGTERVFIVVGGILNTWGVYNYSAGLIDAAFSVGSQLDHTLGDQMKGLSPGEELDGDLLADGNGGTGYTDACVFYVATERYVYRILLFQGLPQHVSRVWACPSGAINGIIVDRTAAEVCVFWDDGDAHLTRVRSLYAGLVSMGDSDVIQNDEGGSITIYADRELPSNPTQAGQYYNAEITGNTFAFNSVSDTAVVVNLRTGSYQSYDTDVYRFYDDLEGASAAWLDPAEDQVWFGAGGFLITYAHNAAFDWGRVYLDRAATERVELNSLLEWFALRAGYAANQVTVTGMTELVSGALLVERVNLFDLLRDSQVVFGFDVYESEAEIKMTRKGRGVSFAVDWTVPAADLTWIQSQGDTIGENDRTFVNARGFLEDPPSIMDLIFIDEALAYTVNMVTYRRTQFPVRTVESDRIQQLVVPIIMTNSEALSYLSRAMFDQWAADNIRALRLGPKYRRMEPTDILSVTFGGFVYVTKAMSVTLNADGSMSITGNAFEAEAAPVVESTGPSVPPDVIVGVSYSDLYIIDAPPQTYGEVEGFGDESMLMPNIVAPQNSSVWEGGMLWTSWDGGAAAERYLNTTEPTFQARAVTVLETEGMDETISWFQTLTVVLVDGEAPETITMDELLAGGNRLYYGATGRWELIAPLEVTDNGDGSYTFAKVLRGLRMTGQAMGSHLPGDRVVSATGAHLLNTPFPTLTLGTTVKAAAVGINSELYATPHQYWVSNANAKKPFEPRGATATLDGSDVDLAWLRSTRATTDFWDWSVPDDVDSEDGVEYVVEIYDAAFTAVVRTVTGITTEAYTYLAADITTDLGGLPAALNVTIYQVSANPAIGRGYGHRRTLTIV